MLFAVMNVQKDKTIVQTIRGMIDMPLKTLNLAADLRESITYDAHTLPLVVCGGSFDDYVGMEWSCHWHEEFEVILVEKGSICCTTYEGLGNPTSFSASVGDVVFINSGVLHSVKATEKGTIGHGFVLSVNFFDFRPLQNITAKMLQPILESGFAYVHAKAEDKACTKLISAITELCAIRANHPNYELYCVELVCKIWRLLVEHITAAKANAISPKKTLSENRVKQMIAYMHEHFHEHISADDLAKHAGISRTECFKSFAEVLKKTPVTYLNEYRLSTAAMLLTYSDRNITEIALSCGFTDTSYFAKMFRRVYGISPKQYRALMG